jgi:hypothetical protein
MNALCDNTCIGVPIATAAQAAAAKVPVFCNNGDMFVNSGCRVPQRPISIIGATNAGNPLPVWTNEADALAYSDRPLNTWTLSYTNNTLFPVSFQENGRVQWRIAQGDDAGYNWSLQNSANNGATWSREFGGIKYHLMNEDVFVSWSGDHVIAPGATLTFKYRILWFRDTTPGNGLQGLFAYSGFVAWVNGYSLPNC